MQWQQPFLCAFAQMFAASAYFMQLFWQLEKNSQPADLPFWAALFKHYSKHLS